eukprot:CAMPEP_0173163152 /NCGR_PEP_ID=MMETSP1105-20130129/19752_1 /TAXON_ID=2985 /ORGANISM="Ochromonas sp., Strain BG-1" /LENGTH=203 /DNA_ID=CAMNT_0014083157 /DNA_START=14 /DNA_END=626 /DNA_ORIENTATION=+
MPVSKRNKIVSLTKTGSKGRSLKSKLLDVLRGSLDEFKRLYAFSYTNMRTSKFRDVRMEWKESKIYMGKNSVTQIAFGQTVEDEYKDNLRHVSKLLEGNVGLLFTNRSHQEVLDYFSGFSSPDFAKAGAIPEETIVLPPGELPFPTTMLDELRKLGMTVEIEDGKVILREELTSKNISEVDRPIINLTITLLCKWEDGSYEEL